MINSVRSDDRDASSVNPPASEFLKKKNRRLSFREKAIGNAKKSLQSTTGGDSNNSILMEHIGILYNYLSINVEEVKKDIKMLRAFEKLVIEANSKISGESILSTILKDHGWNGVRFHYNAHVAVDEDSLLHVLGSLYLSKGNVDTSDDNSVIKSFCPDTLVGCVMHQFTSTKRLSKNFYGSCMLVDISGFTKLSAALCKKGVAGLDDLHIAINGYLGRCVEIVYAHGGDVISFAGDALICIFSSDKAPTIAPASFDPGAMLRQSMAAGVNAAAEMKSVADSVFCDVTASEDPLMPVAGTPSGHSGGGVSTFEDRIEKPSPNALAAFKCAMELKDHYTDTLTCHVAISCGDMVFTTLGGVHNEWIYMVVGSCINEISSCIDAAKSKEVVVTQKVYESLMAEKSKTDTLRMNLTECGNRKLESFTTLTQPTKGRNRLNRISNAPQFITAISKYVPYPVVDALHTNNFRNISELREVTTMFFKLDSFDPKTMVQEIDTLQDFFVMAQAVLAEAGGFMRQFLIDDKGCVLIAMWGVPAFTSTNNCSRAIYAATAINIKTRAMGHQCSIGITTGGVFCGTVGSAERRDYVGIGSKVNMSARLMGKAKGRVLVDVDTYNHLPISGRTPLVLSEAFQLKGLEGDTYSYICPIDGGLSSLSITDDAGGMGDAMIMLQSDISLCTTKLLNELDDCEHPMDTVAFSSSPGGPLSIDGNGADNIKAFSPPTSPTENISTKLISFMSGKSSTKGTGRVAPAPHAHYAFHTNLKPHVRMALIQGPSGSGKNTAVNFFRKGSLARGLRSIYLSCKSGDDLTPFGLIGKLITELIGMEELDTEESQKANFCNIMSVLFPNEEAMPKLQKSASLLKAMKYSWLDPCKDETVVEEVVVVKKPKHTPKFPYIPPKELVMVDDSGMVGSASTKNRRAAELLAEKNSLLDKILIYLLQRTPTAIAVSNAHFADENSWKVLRRMMEFPVQIACMLSILAKPVTPVTAASLEQKKKELLDQAKSGGLGPPGNTLKYVSNPSFHALKQHKHCVAIDMQPLGFGEVDYILAHTGHQGFEKTVVAVAPHLVQTVLHVTNGNPFWCRSIAEFIVERGIEEFMKSIAHASSTITENDSKLESHNAEPLEQEGEEGDHPPPQELQQHNPLYVLVVCRLEKLSTFLQVVIKHASIIGSEFDALTLESVLPKAFAHHIEHSMQLLLESSFILCIDDSVSTQTYCFQNYLIRNALYVLTPPREACKIHLRIAGYIERSFAKNLRPYYTRLCYHYGASPQHVSEAFKYAVKAADDCIGGAAYADALLHVRKANHLVSNVVEARKLLEVIDSGIEDMKPRGALQHIVRRVSSLVRSDNSSTFSFAARIGNMDNTGVQRMYVKLKESISLKVIRFEKAEINTESENENGTSSSLLSGLFKKKDKRYKLQWEASYTANRSMFTPLYVALGLSPSRDRSSNNSVSLNSNNSVTGPRSGPNIKRIGP